MVEPIGAVLTIIAAQLIIPALTFAELLVQQELCFMSWLEELILEMSQGEHRILVRFSLQLGLV